MPGIRQIDSDGSTLHHSPKVCADSLARAQWLIALLMVCLYLGAVGSRWYMTSDSATYMLLGSSLANGDDYTICGQPHTKYPHGFPLFLAGMMSIGLGDMLWLNFAMAGMGLIAIWASYRLLVERNAGEFALPVTVAFGLSYCMFLHSHTQLSDVPFTMLILVGLYCIQRGLNGQAGWLEAGILALVTSCWVRVVGVPLVLAVSVAMCFESSVARRKRVYANAVMLVLGTCATMAFQYWLFNPARHKVVSGSYAVEVSWMTSRGWMEWIVAPFQNLVQTGSQLSRLYTGQEIIAWIGFLLLGVPTLIGCVLALRQRRFLCVAATVGYIGAIVVLRSLLARYLLPVAPLLLWFFARGIHAITTFIRHRFCRQHRVRVWLVLLVLFAGMNALKDVRLVYATHFTDFRQFGSSWPSRLQTAQFLQSRLSDGQLFLGQVDAVVLSYLSGCHFASVDYRSLGTNMEHDALCDFFAKNRVRYVVFERELPFQLPFFVSVRNNMKRLVLKNEYFEVYETPWSAGSEATRMETVAAAERRVRGN